MLDLEARLRRYVEHLDEAYPDIAVEEVLGGRRHRVLAPPLRRRGPLVAVAAAVLALVLIGGVAWLARLSGEEAPPVVTQPDPGVDIEVLPAPDDHVFDPEVRRSLEEFVAGFGDAMSVETSLGTWTWRRMEPASDLVGPPEPTLPDLPESPGIAVTGVEVWYPYWPAAVTAHLGEVTVSVVSVGVGVDWNAVYTFEPGWVEAYWRDAPNLLEIVARQEFETGGGRAEGRDMGVLDVLEVSVVPGDPDAVEFHRLDGGGLVLRLEATDPAIPAELLVDASPSCSWGCPLTVRRLFVESGTDDGVWVDPPWVGRPVVDASVAYHDDRLVLLAVEGSSTSPTLRWWTSRDGLVWEEIAQVRPVVAPADEVEGMSLAGDGERLVLVLDVFGQAQVWTSTDGSTWLRSQIAFHATDVAVTVGAVRTSFGWMMPGLEWPWGHPQCVVWVSADAERWERIPLFPSPVPDGLGSQCHGDSPPYAGEGWFDGDTVSAVAYDLWTDLGWWRGGFED
jgi:hypothetical protein